MSESRWIRLNVNWDESKWLFGLLTAAQLAWIKRLCRIKTQGIRRRVNALRSRRTTNKTMTKAQPLPLNTPELLPGYVVTFYQTYKGQKLGPYYARHYMVKGKRKKQYIRPQDLERIRAACQAYRERKKRGSQIARDLSNTLGNINWLARMSLRLRRGPIRPEDHAFAAEIEKRGISIPGRPKLRTKRNFMDHSLTNQIEKFLKQSKKDALRIINIQLANESDEEKWQRWRSRHASNPNPRPIVRVRDPLPDWFSEEEIENEVTNLIKFMETQSANA